MVLAEDLRQAVLQAALQGKLTDQLETDSNVDEMLISIQEEKKLLLDKKNAREEKIIPIEEDGDKPYDIPDNWRWERLGNIGIYKKGPFGSALTKSIFVPKRESAVKVYEQKNAIQKDASLGEYYITKEYFDAKMKGFVVESGDIIVSCAGTIGETYIMPDNIEFGIINQALMRMNIVQSVNIAYFLIYFDNVLKTEAQKGSKGSAIKNIPPFEVFKRMLIPIPPIEEQKRIVEKINAIMPKIDEYEKIEEELEALKKEFPTNMKDALLQAAMQGKLTEQLERDSSVDELLLCIEKDRKNKISSGLTKKDKRLFINYIDDEDASYIIPDTWRMVMLGSIVYKLTDGTHKTPKYAIEGVKFVSVKDMSSGKLDLSNTKFITQEEHDELYKRCNPEKGDMLISKVGTTGVPAIIDTDEQFSLFVSVALLKYNHQYINEKFLYYLLMSPLVQEQVKENTRGIGNKNWVLDFIAKTIIVLPPIEEQQRIVERLDALLPLCEDL